MIPRYVGIVGAEAAKFTALGEQRARGLIRTLLAASDEVVPVLVSGRCPLGGIDVWAEEEYAVLRIAPGSPARPDPIIHAPAFMNWSHGFKPRNIRIAEDSAAVHNIVADSYPATFMGMRFSVCYHCARRARERPHEPSTPAHVKSGGCWTAIHAERLGKRACWWVIHNE